MPLITATGKGFLLTEGVELKYSKTGNAYARLPLVFKNNRKTPEGTWVSDKEIIVEGTVFGKLAESLCEVVDSRQDLNVTGDLYIEEYEGKQRVKMNISSAWPAKEGGRSSFAAVGVSRPAEDLAPF